MHVPHHLNLLSLSRKNKNTLFPRQTSKKYLLSGGKWEHAGGPLMAFEWGGGGGGICNAHNHISHTHTHIHVVCEPGDILFFSA